MTKENWKNINKTGAFTVSFATADTVIPCDYVGIISANDEPNKFAKAGFHATKSGKKSTYTVMLNPEIIKKRKESADEMESLARMP